VERNIGKDVKVMIKDIQDSSFIRSHLL